MQVISKHFENIIIHIEAVTLLESKRLDSCRKICSFMCSYYMFIQIQYVRQIPFNEKR